jgi:NAD(P)-dependent dehydrogenase (short-subunit alcohol dehydrogenase family)
MRGLKDKRVLITGGASGIGYAATQRFLKEGARVAVLDRDAEACEQLRSSLPHLEEILVADVAKDAQVEEAFRQVDATFAGLDILVNGAGVSHRQAFLDITLEAWREVVGINLTGAFHVAQQAARRMSLGAGGVILNVASTNGIVGYPHYADYNASKAGLIALTRSMALELAPKVRVIAVCPGYVLTPMQQAEYTAEMIDEVNRKIPLRRHASPEEVAGLFAFLCSEEAAFITGHPLIIDGGEIAGGLASR